MGLAMTSHEHVPVLASEVVKAFMEQPRAPQKFFEGTFGRGGHTRLLLDEFPQARVVSFDRDADAVKFAHEKFKNEIATGRFEIVHDDFRNLSSHDSLGLFDGALVDLGVSSPQLENAGRGFSFQHDGPLDMRMDRSQDLTAAEIVNTYEENDLSDIFFQWGEVRRPARVVRAIVHDRETTPFTSTLQLASLISRVERAGRGGGKKGRRIHPATPYFMALRIAVNRELDDLENFFENTLPLHMEPGGRAIVISFHSLEDRIVKWAFKDMHGKTGKILTKKVIEPSEQEIQNNPRSRSSKMRIFEMGGLS